MKRNVTIFLLTIISAFCISFGFAACGNKSENSDLDVNTNENSVSYPTEHFDNLNLDLYSFNGHFYYVYTGHRDWQDAENYCEDLGGHLAIITSQEEQALVENIVKNANVACWLGAYKSGQNFVWLFGEAFNYSNWHPTAPHGEDENYIGIYANNSDTRWSKTGKWNVFRASSGTIRGFVCEWEDKSSVGDVFKYYKKIVSIDELKGLNNNSGKHVLGADIDLTGENWIPINGFTGVLVGGDYKIKNLTINSVNDSNLGLFGTLQGTVKNLAIENAQITSRGDAGTAGIVAGTNNGRIENVTVSGIINPLYYNNVGGIAGCNNIGAKTSGGIIIDCTNDAEVRGNNNVGGIFGNATFVSDNFLADNINNGKITGANCVGGIGGNLDSDTTYTLISNCSNNGIVQGTNKIGGVFGCIGFWFDLSELSNFAEVVGNGDYIGGLIGYGSGIMKLSACENQADITGYNYVGGWCGYCPNTNIQAAGQVNSSTITGKGYVGGFAGCAEIIKNAENSGAIISTGVIVENGSSKAYVGGVAGYCRGLINCTNNSDIRVETGGDYVGGCAGYIDIIEIGFADQISGCLNLGEVYGNNVVGGIAGCIIGYNSKALIISNNENRNTINGMNRVGGNFGQANLKFEMSILTNSGQVNGSGDYIGGLIGYGADISKLVLCENKADVFGKNYVGGIVGSSPNARIQASGIINNNTITGQGYVGGFAGYAGVIENAVNNGTIVLTGVVVEKDNNRSYVGGIAGYCKGLINCTNNSDIEVKTGGDFVGGLAGYVYMPENDNIYNSTNNGTVSASKYVGGIAGYVLGRNSSGSSVSISNNKNTNTITGSSIVGGIFGYLDGYFQVTYCSNEAIINGNSYVGGIIGYYNNLNTNSALLSTNTTLYDSLLGK